MIIQCSTCGARFRLDEEKIKGRGARVRCRRCGESIVVLKPEGAPAGSPAPAPAESGGDLLDLRSIVRESLGEPTAPPPPTRAEEPGPSFVESPREAASRPSAGEPAPPRPGPETPPPPERDEVDMAFEKFLASGTEEPPTPHGGGEPAGPGNLIVDFSPEEKLELPKEPPAPETTSRPDFLESDTDSLAFLKNEYETRDKPGTFDISISVTPEPPPGAAEGEAAEATPEPPPPAAVFLPRAEPGPAQAEFPPAAEPSAPPQTGEAAAHEPPAAAPEEAPAAKAYARKRPSEAAPAASSFLRPSVIALVLVFAALAGGGAYLGFTKNGQELLRGLVPGMESLWLRGGKPGPQYDVRNLIGYYETGAKAGNLFVIKGQVTNVGRTRKNGIRIRAALLDAAERPIAERTGYAGNILPGETLRTATREKIDETLSNRFGDGLVAMDIAPGKTVAFMVVFFDVPEGINAYRLEAKDGE